MKIRSKDFRVPHHKKRDIKRLPTIAKPFCQSKKEYKDLLEKHIAELTSLQQLHLRVQPLCMLLIFQGMDSAGKDGAIRHRRAQSLRTARPQFHARGRGTRLFDGSRIRSRFRQSRSDRCLYHRRRRIRDLPEGSWKSVNFLNPARDGAVLPILHLNGYKISGPTVQGRTSDEDLKALYTGRGYNPYFVEGDDPEIVHQLLGGTLDDCYAEIRAIQQEARQSGFRNSQSGP